MSTYVDIAIECGRCKVLFTWSAGEQSFFARQSPPFSRPKICKACRAARHAQRAAEAQTAGWGCHERSFPKQEAEAAQRSASVAERQ